MGILGEEGEWGQHARIEWSARSTCIVIIFITILLFYWEWRGDQVSGGKRGRWCQRNPMREWAATHIGRVGVLCNRHVGQVKDVRDGWLCPVHNSLVSTCV